METLWHLIAFGAIFEDPHPGNFVLMPSGKIGSSIRGSMLLV